MYLTLGGLGDGLSDSNAALPFFDGLFLGVFLMLICKVSVCDAESSALAFLDFFFLTGLGLLSSS